MRRTACGAILVVRDETATQQNTPIDRAARARERRDGYAPTSVNTLIVERRAEPQSNRGAAAAPRRGEKKGLIDGWRRGMNGEARDACMCVL